MLGLFRCQFGFSALDAALAAYGGTLLTTLPKTQCEVESGLRRRWRTTVRTLSSNEKYSQQLIELIMEVTQKRVYSVIPSCRLLLAAADGSWWITSVN